MSITLLRKINKAAVDPNYFDNNYLGEVLGEAAGLIEQLKKENESAREAFKEIYNSRQGLIAITPWMIAEKHMRGFTSWFDELTKDKE